MSRKPVIVPGTDGDKKKPKGAGKSSAGKDASKYAFGAQVGVTRKFEREENLATNI